MADTTRSAQAVRQTYTFGDRRFIGIDTNTQPNNLQDGFLQVADNLWNDGGALVTRSGFQAQLDTAHAGEIHAMISYRRPDNTATDIIYALGNSSTATSTIYRYTKDNPNPVSLGTITGYAPNVRMVQHGKYIYGVPGVGGGSLFRYDGSTMESLPLVKAPYKDGANLITPSATVVTNPIKSITAGSDINNTPSAGAFGMAFSNPTTGVYDLITGTSTTTGYTFESDVDGSNPSSGTWTSAGSPTVKQYTNIDAALAGGEKIANYPTQSGNKAVLLDGGSDAITKSITTLPSYSFDGTTKTTALYALNCLMYNNDVLDSRRNQGVLITVTGYASSTPIVGAVFTQIVNPTVAQSTTDWKVISAIIDFRAFQGNLTRIDVKFQTANQAQSTTPDSKGVFVDNIGFYAVLSDMSYTTGDVTDGLGLIKIKAKQQNTNLQPSHAGYLKGTALQVTVSNDLSSKDTVSLRMDFPDQYKTNLPYMSLGIRNTGTATISWTGYGTYDTAKGYMSWKIYGIPPASRNNVQYVYVRMETEYEGVTHDSLLFSIGELTTDGGLTPDTTYEYIYTKWYPKDNNAKPPYFHEGDVWQQGLESLPSAVSNSVSTTSAYSKNTIVLNPREASTSIPLNQIYDTYSIPSATTAGETVTQNVPAVNQKFVMSATTGNLVYVDVSSVTRTINIATAYTPVAIPSGQEIQTVTSFAGTFPVWLQHSVAYGPSAYEYSHLCVYRRGQGVFPDGRFRLVAVVPISASSSGKGWTSTVNTVSTWKEITLNDSVPDGDIFYEAGPYDPGYYLESGRDVMPVGASAIAVHTKRLWVAVNNTVYASWMLNPLDEYGMYTTLVPDSSDPNIYVKGTSFTVSTKNDNEKIAALLSYAGDGMFVNNTTSASLLVLREQSVLPILGFDPTNFTIQSMVREYGIGCICPRGTTSFYGQMLWQSPQGMVQFSDRLPVNRSVELRRLLSLDKTNAAPDITPSAYRNIVYSTHNQRLYIFAPTVTDTLNTAIYVYDLKTQGWTRWRTPLNGSTYIGFTSGVSLSTGNDTADFYAGGSNGQIYRLLGHADRLTLNGSVQNVPWTLTTRQYGQTYSEGIAYYNQNRINQLDVHYWNIKPTLVVTTSASTDITANNDFTAGDAVVFNTTIGSLVAGTTYFVIAAGLTRNTFRVATAAGGSAITIGTAGTVVLTYGFDHTLSWQVQNELGVAVFTPNATNQSFLFASGVNKTVAIRNVNRDVLGTVSQINLSGSTKTPARIMATHVHSADARIARV